MHKQHIFCTKKNALEGNPPACHEDQKLFVREACKPSSVIGGHLSRPIVTGGFKRNPESSTGRLKRSFVSCCGWGLHRGQVAMPRVSSYLTFPPLHMPEGICGISLLHFPWGRPRRVLPGILPCAARTFLTPFGARPPGSLTNAGIIARSEGFVNDGKRWRFHPHTPDRGPVPGPLLLFAAVLSRFVGADIIRPRKPSNRKSRPKPAS